MKNLPVIWQTYQFIDQEIDGVLLFLKKERLKSKSRLKDRAPMYNVKPYTLEAVGCQPKRNELSWLQDEEEKGKGRVTTRSYKLDRVAQLLPSTRWMIIRHQVGIFGVLHLVNAAAA